MEVDVLLCDSARVREGLLHVLGGGITNLWMDQFPAMMGVDLAVVATVTPGERDSQHKLDVNVLGQDGEVIAQANGEFGVSGSADVEAWEALIVPLVLPLANVAIPEEGAYMIDVLVDNRSVRNLRFRARPRPTTPGAG